MQVKRQSNGEVIDLGSEIARGGEGAIHPYPPDASLVAKVYHANKLKDIDSDKLRVMLTNPPDDSVAKSHGCVSIAWPVDLLLSIDGSEQIMGFLMPRVPMQQVRPIHDYYSPKTRREKNLGFNYLSLHRTARNFAAAMSALHAKQYVIGDVNESNILVYDTAMVTLVDTDSFQVRDFQQGKVYRCPVGKAEYTPPELQHKTFADYDRTTEHDLFGLGVLIFQLLMEGTHPFAGVYQGNGEPPLLEKRILAGHFPHGTKTVPYRPAPNAPPFEVLHPTLRQLFVRCFEDGHNNPQARPDARSWVKALEAAEKALVSCGVNSEHKYGGHLRDCPWCERKKQLNGLDPFPAMSGGQSNIPVQIPLRPPSKPKPVSSPAPSPTPSPTAIPYQRTPTPAPAPATTYATFSPLTAAPTATPTFNTPSLLTRKFPKQILTLGGIAAVISVSFFLFYPHQNPELKAKQKQFVGYIKAMILNPNDAETYNKRGRIRFEDLGDKQGAIEDYEKASQINPKFAEAYKNLGDVHYDLGDKKAAIANYTIAIKINPKFADAYSNRGVARRFSGDKAAIEDFTKAIEINPNLAEAYKNRGDSRYFSFKPAEKKTAIEDYTKAIQINPKFAEAYTNRGITRYHLGYHKAAIEDFNQVVLLNPNDAKSYTQRADYLGLEDKKGAIADCTKAIQLQPSNSDPYSARGNYRYQLGDYQGAIADYTKAIELTPNEYSYVLYNNRGWSRYKLGDKQGAIEDYTKTIQLSPGFTEAYHGRGLSRYELGDKQGAITDYTEAIKIIEITRTQKNYAIVYFDRGIARYNLGNKKGAIEDYQQAAQSYFDMGIAVYNSGNKKEAIEEYQQAAQSYQKAGDTEGYKKSMDQIKKIQE
ncbi:tetratricopeptide repeat protein [Microcoleus sp.]|uniref:tetratricopeptide repeat protein n=1 Tax=Microcoleus sp. TaxID=44472 RepID=UPI0035241A50